MIKRVLMWVFGKVRVRPVPLTAEDLLSLGSLDRESTIARAVPHLCEALVIEAETELATAKPYGEGYAYAAARVAGRISAALELAERWNQAIDTAWKRREEQERLLARKESNQRK